MNFAQRIQLQALTRTSNALGEVVETWTDYTKVGSNIRQTGSRLAPSGEKVVDTKSLLFEVRLTGTTNTLTTDYRIITTDGEVWTITDVDKWTLRHVRVVKITAHRSV